VQPCYTPAIPESYPSEVAMKSRKFLLLYLCLFLLASCRTAANSSSREINTEVARQLTSQALITQAGQTLHTGPATDQTGSGQLPSVTPTGTPPPSPTPTITPTGTNTATFTPPAEDPVPGLGTPTYRTDFADAAYWTVYSDNSFSYGVVDHKFEMIARNANSYDSWVLTAWKLKNFYLEMTATSDTCSGRDRYGFVVGSPFPAVGNNYLLRQSCNGEYSFGYFGDTSVDNKFHFIREWTKSPFIYAGAGQSNRLGIMVEGGTHISLYANGHFLHDLVEPSFGEGLFGVVIGSVNTPNYTVRISTVAFWKLP
jgi:hypothetical protein